MGLKVRYNGGVLDLSDAKYNPNGYGTKRLKIRTGQGSNAIKEYGLATSASYASDKWLKFNINGQHHYIATSRSSTRQSNRTSYSSYYTYTYTQSYPRSRVLTRQGTQTTYTYTEPARYTYRASYYNGIASYYTMSMFTNYYYRTYALSGTRSSQYNTWRASNVTYSWSGARTEAWSGNRVTVRGTLGNGWRFSGGNYAGQTSYTNTIGVVVSINHYTSSKYLTASQTWTASYTDYKTGIGGNKYSKTNGQTTAGLAFTRTMTGTKYQIHNITTPTLTGTVQSTYTTSRISNYSVTPPNYVLEGALMGPTGYRSNTYTVNAANYRSSSSSMSGTGGYVQGASFSKFSNGTFANPYQSSTVRTGNATLTSTNTPIGGVPSNYTLSAGPSLINSYASYTYTNQYCTRTYASNYSTSYWTVTSTYTSNNWVYSSLGSTVYTTSSAYTEHNFV